MNAKPYDSSAVAARTRSAASAAPDTAGRGAHHARSEGEQPAENNQVPSALLSERGATVPPASAVIALISVHMIEAAGWQPRKVFSGIERLADTIAGSSEHAALGVLEPLLVRRLPAAGKYELIDGERRWRACKLVASRQPDGDYLVPCRVFDVSDAIAPLLGQVANVERENPNPLETAYGYMRARDALRRVAPEMGTVRAMAPLSRHGKSQLNEYIVIAENLTDEFISAAGVVTAEGKADFEALGTLGPKALVRIAREGDEARRAESLRLALGLQRLRPENGDKAGGDRTADVPARPRTLAERVALHRDVGRQVGSLRRPAQRRTPAEARRLLEEELLPATIAFAERACSESGGSGFHMDADAGCVALLLPTPPEALSTEQVARLRDALAGLMERLPPADRRRRDGRRATVRSRKTPADPKPSSPAPSGGVPDA